MTVSKDETRLAVAIGYDDDGADERITWIYFYEIKKAKSLNQQLNYMEINFMKRMKPTLDKDTSIEFFFSNENVNQLILVNKN